MDVQIKTHINKGLVPCGGTIKIQQAFDLNGLNVILNIYIHPNTHPLLLVPPTIHKCCRVGPFIPPYAFTAVDPSSDIS